MTDQAEEPRPRPNFGEAVARGIREGMVNAFRRRPPPLRFDMSPRPAGNRAERRRRAREERRNGRG